MLHYCSSANPAYHNISCFFQCLGITSFKSQNSQSQFLKCSHILNQLVLTNLLIVVIGLCSVDMKKKVRLLIRDFIF